MRLWQLPGLHRMTREVRLRSGPPAMLFASTQQQPELPHLAKLNCQNCALWTSRTILSKPMLYLSRR